MTEKILASFYGHNPHAQLKIVTTKKQSPQNKFKMKVKFIFTTWVYI